MMVPTCEKVGHVGAYFHHLALDQLQMGRRMATIELVLYRQMISEGEYGRQYPVIFWMLLML
jgi:hypothetical protein